MSTSSAAERGRSGRPGRGRSFPTPARFRGTKASRAAAKSAGAGKPSAIERRDAMIPRGIISADGHVCEPPNCYVDFIDPKSRDVAPRMVEQADGTEAFVVHGMKRPFAIGFIDGAGLSVRERMERARRIKFSDIRQAAYIV